MHSRVCKIIIKRTIKLNLLYKYYNFDLRVNYNMYLSKF